MRWLVTPTIILASLMIAGSSILYGCAAPATTEPVGLTNAQGAAVAVTFALVTYTPQFSSKLAGELRTAPPELQQFVVDAEKLRCAIKPNMPVCADLLK